MKLRTDLPLQTRGAPIYRRNRDNVSQPDETWRASQTDCGGIERMSGVEFEQGAVRIDASIIAAGFAIAPALVQHLMHEGQITSLYERGLDRDAGTFRITFFHGRRRLRLVVDASGNVIDRSVTNIGRRGHRAARREPDCERPNRKPR